MIDVILLPYATPQAAFAPSSHLIWNAFPSNVGGMETEQDPR